MTTGKFVASFACALFVAGATPALAATIDIFAIVDGQVSLIGGVPQNASTGQLTNTSQNLVPNQELRSIYEFDLPILTEQIVSATFFGAVTQNSAAPGTLDFFGYSGNGIVETGDALQTSTAIGNTTIASQVPTGTSVPISVSLSPSFISGLGSGFLGIVTTAGAGDTILVASLESTAFARPMLRLETQSVDGQPPTPVPEPGTIFLVGGVLAGLAARRRRRGLRPER